MLKLVPKPPSPQDKQVKIDRYGELQRQVDLFAPTVQEHKELASEINGWMEADPADKPAFADGVVYRVQGGPRKRERTITSVKKCWAALKAAIGAEALPAAIMIPLGLIDKYVPESEQKGFITQERSGSRTLDVVAMHALSDAA